MIISHVIVLFEYIEEAHERGEPLRRAVIDAALVRLRPVLVTVLATVGGLIPLAIEGGPALGAALLRADHGTSRRDAGDQGGRARSSTCCSSRTSN